MQKGTFEEAEASFRSQIKVLEEDLARQKVSTPNHQPCSSCVSQHENQRLMQESQKRYRREEACVLSMKIHDEGMQTIRKHLLNPPRVEKTSFLSQERNRVSVIQNKYMSDTT